VTTLSTKFKDQFRMIISINVSHFVKICQVLTILHNLSVGVSLILGHDVAQEQLKLPLSNSVHWLAKRLNS